MTPIDWHLLGQAVNYYVARGYTYQEVPWIVPAEISQQTFTGEAVRCQLGDLVGSAEQGFLALPSRPNAKLVACSPCFRAEPVLNRFYQTWFMKVELYREGEHLMEVLEDAEAFMARWPIKRLATPEGIDLTLNGIEVGSYGIRHQADRTWTYGTGLALPRLTVASQAPS